MTGIISGRRTATGRRSATMSDRNSRIRVKRSVCWLYKRRTYWSRCFLGSYVHNIPPFVSYSASTKQTFWSRLHGLLHFIGAIARKLHPMRYKPAFGLWIPFKHRLEMNCRVLISFGSLNICRFWHIFVCVLQSADVQYALWPSPLRQPPQRRWNSFSKYQSSNLNILVNADK